MPLPAPVAPLALTRGGAVDFARAPFLVIWEVTRACALACVHCRADAIARRDPRELTTEEAFALVDQVAEFGAPQPLVVLTGGDPMWRKDLRDIVACAAGRGLSVALTPSGTAAATSRRLEELRAAGLSRLAISLDGPDAETHDAFRRVRGSFDWTMKIVNAAIDLGIPLQVNTTVSRRTLPTLVRTAERIRHLPLALWAVFFLVQTGRGATLDQIEATECETVLRWLAAMSRQVPFGIKTTEAPHFRRVLWESELAASNTPAGRKTPGDGAMSHGPANGSGERVTLKTRRSGPARGTASGRAVTDGNGFVFVDHVGNICPSGFLPIVRGNVREGALVSTYRDDALFRQLRDADALEGKCGRCRFRALCGGSRSRAFSATGNPLASDPLCAYEPGPEVEPLV